MQGASNMAVLMVVLGGQSNPATEAKAAFLAQKVNVFIGLWN